MKDAKQHQRRSGRLLKCINVVLVFCLLILSAVLYCSVFDKRIPIPRFVIDKLNQELVEHGVEVDFSSVGLGLDFSVVAENVSMRACNAQSDFLVAEKMYADVSFFELISGEMPIKYIDVVNGALSPSYSNVHEKPIITDVNVKLRLLDDSCYLDFLHLNIDNVNVYAKGRIDKNSSTEDIDRIINVISKKFEKEETPKKKKSPLQSYDEIFANYDSLKKHLENFTNPSVNIDFTLCGDGSNYVNVDVVATRASLKYADVSVNAKNLRASLEYKYAKIDEKLLVSFSANSIDCNKFNASIANLSAKTGIHVSEKDVALFDIDLSLTQAKIEDYYINNFILRKDMLTDSSYGDNWLFFVASGDSRLNGSVGVKNNNLIVCKVDGDVDIMPLFKCKELADVPEMKDFSFAHNVLMSANVSYKIFDEFPEIDARIEASDCVIMRLLIDYASSEISFKNGVLNCYNIKAKSKEGWGAIGSFKQNFINYEYDISVQGNLRPMAIAHFMEPWWTKVMGSFTFAENAVMPYADVRVEGTWGAPENIWCYGFVSGNNALYNGAKFEDFSLKVWVNPTRITLYDIEIISGNGARSGKCFIEWLYDANKGLTSYDRQRLFIHSTLNSTELVALGGSDAKEVLDVVKFSIPPDLTLNGLMYNPDNNPKKLRDIYNAEVHAKGRTSVEMIDLYDARFSARSDTINTDIYNANFHFCGGDASGEVSLLRTANAIFVDGHGEANRMNQGMFFDFMASLGSDSSDKGKSLDSTLGGSSDGEVSAVIKLKGDVRNMMYAQADGKVSINSKNFLKLNLLGEISKAFRAIRLPLGSFDITKVESSFALENAQVNLSPIVMSGPALRIVGAASYSIQTDAVKGELKAYPFDKVDNTIVSAVNTLVNPLMDSVRVIVSGTLEKPDFSAKMTPADIIRSEKNVINKIEESLKK